MKVCSPNWYNFKKPSVLAHPHTTVHASKTFFYHFDNCLEHKSVSYTMVHTPCIEEVCHDIGHKSGCLCPTSFLKAGFTVFILGLCLAQNSGSDRLKKSPSPCFTLVI